MQPTTLTVFRGYDSPCLLRKAVWHRESDRTWRILHGRDVTQPGEHQLPEPAVSVRDAEVPFQPLRELLKAMAACTIPAIALQSP
ncbi:MAG TPA: hypothetical protein VHX68_20650, partial [Planctomycetaceae bacterium]|nr:hypothetical protein [Planctomycetaceae bacterium]